MQIETRVSILSDYLSTINLLQLVDGKLTHPRGIVVSKNEKLVNKVKSKLGDNLAVANLTTEGYKRLRNITIPSDVRIVLLDISLRIPYNSVNELERHGYLVIRF